MRYVLGDATPTATGARQVADIVAAMAPPPPGAAGTVAMRPASSASAGRIAMALAPGVAAGTAGAVIWKKHRVLGFLAGHAVGQSGYQFIRGGDKKKAICNLAVEGAGVVGALKLFKGRKPVYGWLAGVLGGAVVTAFVPGSPANEAYRRLRSKIGM